MNKPFYLEMLIGMQNNDELYIVEGRPGYKNAIKFLNKCNWEIDGYNYSKGWCYDSKKRAIYIERAIDKLRREIDFDILKKGTLEKSCIDNELYIIGDYGLYWAGANNWCFGKYEKIITKYRDLCPFTFEYKTREDIKYRILDIELLTNQNYEILLEGYEK